MGTYRYFLLTVFRSESVGGLFSESDIQFIRNFFSSRGFRYVFQCESAPTTSRHHLQCLLYSEIPIRIGAAERTLSALRDFDYGIDLKGSPPRLNAAAVAYVTKSDTRVSGPYVSDNPPPAFAPRGTTQSDTDPSSPVRSRRSSADDDAEFVVDKLIAGYPVREIIVERPRLWKSISQLLQASMIFGKRPPRNREIFVYYLYGESGVGKSAAVFHDLCKGPLFPLGHHPRHFDGYANQDSILIEEFNCKSFPIEEFNRITDRWPVHYNVKYSIVYSNYTHVYITSNFSPQEIAIKMCLDPAQAHAFYRRLTNVIFFPNKQSRFRCSLIDTQWHIDQSQSILPNLQTVLDSIAE